MATNEHSLGLLHSLAINVLIVLPQENTERILLVTTNKPQPILLLNMLNDSLEVGLVFLHELIGELKVLLVPNQHHLDGVLNKVLSEVLQDI